MVERQIDVADEQALVHLGGQLALALTEGGVVYLDGTLGAGKTTLSRGVIQGLGHRGAVKSPTYTLVEPYDLAGRVVYHFDLYRLHDPEELELLGIRDYCQQGHILLIEWPERGQPLLPKADIHVTITVVPHGRTVHLRALTTHGQAALLRLVA